MNKSKFLKIILFLAVCSTAMLVLYVFLFNDIRTKNQNISEKSQYLSSEISREDYVLTTQRLLENYNDDINMIKSSIVSASGEVSFIESLELVARQNGLSIGIDSINVENDPKNSSTTMVTLKIKANTTGPWANTYKFVSQLESFVYKTKLNSLVLSKLEDFSESGSKIPGKRNQWKASFELNVLKYK